jgi:hypothetical protein
MKTPADDKKFTANSSLSIDLINKEKRLILKNRVKSTAYQRTKTQALLSEGREQFELLSTGRSIRKVTVPAFADYQHPA